MNDNLRPIIIPPTIPPSPPLSPVKRTNDASDNNDSKKRKKDQQEWVSDRVKLEKAIVADPYVGQYVCKSKCTACDGIRFHRDEYYDWIKYKYDDDKTLDNVSKCTLRETVYAEYFRLRNFDHYRRMKLHRHCAWSYNINERGTIPECIYIWLCNWVDARYRMNMYQWITKKTKSLADDRTAQDAWVQQVQCDKEKARLYRQWLNHT